MNIKNFQCVKDSKRYTTAFKIIYEIFNIHIADFIVDQQIQMNEN